MRKCILLVLMSGILFGSKTANTSTEKISKKSETYYATATTAKSNQAKKLDEVKTKASQKLSAAKNSATKAVKKVTSTVTNAKSSEASDTSKKTAAKTDDVKKTETKATTEKTTPVKTTKNENTAPAKDTKTSVNTEVKTYCNTPIGKHQFYQLNDKGEYRANIKFKYCMIKGEKKEQMNKEN